MRTRRTTALALCGALCLLPGFSLAQDSGDAGMKAKKAPELPDLTPIEDALEELRELDFKQSVPGAIQSLEDFGAKIDEELAKGFPPEKREAMMRGLIRLGLLLEPIDLADGFKNALLSQAGAYYDPETDHFYYLMLDMPKDMLDVMAAHELVHALQDQHFDLAALFKDLEEPEDGVRNDDAVLAGRYLVEGEATYVMTLWQMKTQMGVDLAANPALEKMSFQMMADMDLEMLIQMTKSQSQLGEDSAMGKAMAAMDDIPPYILQPLISAYMGGAFYTMKLRHEGGWDAVSAAYGDLPASSEQVMHPEKYTDERDHPTPVSIPAIPALEEGGWERIDAAIHGELYLGLLLDNHGVEEHKEAAAGWDGDLYAAYRDGAGKVAIVLTTTWDSEDDADEFFSAYDETLGSKYPGLSTPPDQPKTPDTVSYSCGPEQGHGLLALRGQEVFAIEGFSAAETASVLAALEAVELNRRD